MRKLIAIIPAAFIAFAIYTAILILFCGIAQGQTTYQLNYDSIRVNKTAGTGSTSMYGKVYLKNVALGLVSDSMLVIRNSRIFKVLKTNGTVTSVSGTSPISVANGTTTPVISMTPASATDEGYMTIAAQTIAGIKTYNTGSGYAGYFNKTISTGGILGLQVLGVDKSFLEWNVNDGGTAAGTAMNLRNNQGAIGLYDSTNGGIKISGGIPSAPTATAGTNTTQIASTAFVTTAVAGATIGLSAIGATPNANGATITGSTLNLQPASDSFGGVVTTEAQTIAGVKTFTGTMLTAGIQASQNIISSQSASNSIVVQSTAGSGSMGIVSATGNSAQLNYTVGGVAAWRAGTSTGSLNYTINNPNVVNQPNVLTINTATNAVSLRDIPAGTGGTDSVIVHNDATDELRRVGTTGTGTAVFSTSPTLIAPVLGNATGGTLGLSGTLTGVGGTFSSDFAVGTVTPYAFANYRFITTNNAVTGGGLIMQTAGVNKAAVYNTSAGLWLEGGTITIGNSGFLASTSVIIAAPLTGTSATFTTTTGALTIPRLTTTERNALIAVNGMLIYNTTTAKFQGYEAGAWVNLL